MKAGVMKQYVKTVDVDKLFRKCTEEDGNDTTNGKNALNHTLNSICTRGFVWNIMYKTALVIASVEPKTILLECWKVVLLHISCASYISRSLEQMMEFEWGSDQMRLRIQSISRFVQIDSSASMVVRAFGIY